MADKALIGQIHFCPLWSKSAQLECPLCANSGLMQRSKYQPLFDDVVGTGEERRRHGEAERFGGLHIDRQLKFGRCLHRQVCGLGAPENLVHLLGRVAKLIIPVETIGYQATGCYELSKSINVGHLILSRQSDNG